jgi:transposase
MQVTTIGLDIAKRVFQIHGVDAVGTVVVRSKLRRSELLQFFTHLAPCLVGIEACATAHHWAWELAALGHQVRLVPPLRLEAENAVLRHQLIVLRRRSHGRVRLTNHDRWFFSQLYRWFPLILKVLAIVRPETLARWRRVGFRG